MSIFASREFLESVENEAFETLARFEDQIVSALIDGKGLAYGDVELTRADRIEKFMDDESRGVNEALRLSNPDEYAKRVRQFRRDVTDMGLIDG